MTIGIDIDDTLTDTFHHMIPYVASYCHRPEAELREKGISYENLPPEWGIDSMKMWKALFDTVVPLTPAKEGAKEALELLHAKGHRIIIVTARTNDFYTDCVATTKQELRNLAFPYDKLVCSYAKDEICRNEGIDVFIDDAVGNCRKVAAAGVRTFMMDSTLNQGQDLPGVTRVYGWKEFLSVLGIC